jgi:hypothetical protein
MVESRGPRCSDSVFSFSLSNCAVKWLARINCICRSDHDSVKDIRHHGLFRFPFLVDTDSQSTSSRRGHADVDPSNTHFQYLHRKSQRFEQKILVTLQFYHETKKKKTGLEAVMEVEECLEMDSRHHTRDIARRARCRRIRRLFVTRVAL